MKTILYADILFIEGVIINYTLLLCTAHFASFKKNRWRLILSATAGGAASFLILIPSPGLFFEVVIKIIVSLLIVMLCFNVFGKALVKAFLWYMLFNCLLAGLLLLFYFMGGVGFAANNMQVYFDISAVMLVGSALALYLLMRIISLFFGKPETGTFETAILYGDSEFVFMARYDSGFVAKDILQNGRLLLASLPDIKKSLPTGLTDALLLYFNLGDVSPGLTLLMLNSAFGGELLPAIYPVTATINNKVFCDVKICFTKNKIDADGAAALLSVDFKEIF